MTNIDNTTNENEDFTIYYNKEINPLLGDCEIIKSRFKQKFWVFFWSALAINCINILFVLFNVLLREKEFDITDITTLLFFSTLIVLYPFYMYKFEDKPNFVEAFFNFFGKSTSKNVCENYMTDSIFMPSGDKLIVCNHVEGTLNARAISLSEIQCLKTIKKIKVDRCLTKGIHMTLRLPVNCGHIIFWDKNNYNKNSDTKNLTEIKNTNIPIANYYHIFSDNSDVSNNLISVQFFETLLDIKDVFSASAIDVEIEDDKVDMYIENAKFPLFYKDNLMKLCLQENDFQEAYKIIEKIIVWNETVDVLSLG